jgi:uncharacterized protein YdhG (YjbR/CyaY superfamily)
LADQLTAIDDYIAAFPEDVQAILEQVRRAIRRAAPRAEEAISYQIPTFNLDGTYLVYFAAWKHHIGLYPVPAFDEAIEEELSPCRAGRASLRFPIRKPIPYDLVERTVALLVKQRTEEDR